MHLANLTSFLDKVYLALFVSHHTDSFQPTLSEAPDLLAVIGTHSV